jgi:perosamine synthetase
MGNESKIKSDYHEYMNRINNESIPAYEPTFGNEEMENLKEVMSSGWISEGKYSRKCESFLSKYCNRDGAVITNSGTAALIIGMKSCGIGYGDEVIVPSLSHSADPNSISAIGAKVKFSDVNLDTLCLSADLISENITNKTKAILNVCAYGNSGDLDKIEQLAKDENLIFINDCAPALGCSYNEKPMASYGDFAMLSFFSDKTITMGEGGMLLTDNEKLLSLANIYKHDGRRERGHDLIEEAGFNFRITELQAAIGLAQLNRIKDTLKKKKDIHRKYDKALKGISNARLFTSGPCRDIYMHRNIIFVDDASDVISKLVDKGVGARSLFHPMHKQPKYNTGENFCNTDKLFETGVCLPSAPTLNDDDIDYIANCLKEIL